MGETTFKLKAERFLIRKKKLGFIRFGLAQEGLFHNAEVSFFRKKNKQPFKDSLADLSLKEISPATEIKRLTSLVMTPVTIFFYDENNEFSRIDARNASFGKNNEEVVLTGNVRMAAGGKQIKTDRLIFFPEKEKIYLPGNFLLESQGEKISRKPITTDIFLNSI